MILKLANYSGLYALRYIQVDSIHWLPCLPGISFWLFGYYIQEKKNDLS